MDDTRRQPQTHLFTLRLWLADIGDGQTEWRGRLQHVMSGKICYFRDWSTLAAYLRDMLSNLESIHPDMDAGG